MTLEKCSNCGMCKSVCPIFKAMLEETTSSRGRAVLLKKDIMDAVFYTCSLCGACDLECPAGIEISEKIKKMRERMVNTNIETKPNKAMMKNFREYGNPYGKVEKGKTPKDLYCC